MNNLPFNIYLLFIALYFITNSCKFFFKPIMMYLYLLDWWRSITEIEINFYNKSYNIKHSIFWFGSINTSTKLKNKVFQIIFNIPIIFLKTIILNLYRTKIPNYFIIIYILNIRIPRNIYTFKKIIINSIFLRILFLTFI